MLLREILAVLLIAYVAYVYAMCVPDISPISSIFNSFWPQGTVRCDVILPNIEDIPVIENPLSKFAVPAYPIDWMDSFRNEHASIRAKSTSVPDHDVLTN
jgi:hypothetical protein